MLFGPRAWWALFLTSAGAIAWTEAVMATVRAGSETGTKIAACLPLFLVFGLIFAWRWRHPIPTRPESERVAARLRFNGALTYLDRGSLRRDGGVLVFEGSKIHFAIGHDGLYDRPMNLIGDYGAKLANAPEGTRLALRGDPNAIKEWAKESSEPTRIPVPLYVMPEPEGPPPGYLLNFVRFAVGCTLTGTALGAYLDWRGFSPPGRPIIGILTVGMGALVVLIGFAVLTSLGDGKSGRLAAKAAGFQEVEPWKPAANPSEE